VEERGQTLLLDDTVLVSGQVERVSEFEQGFPIHFARSADGWEPDPMIWDDQNLIVNVKGKGLIVSGCSHAGAVNVLHNARRLTGEQRIGASSAAVICRAGSSRGSSSRRSRRSRPRTSAGSSRRTARGGRRFTRWRARCRRRSSSRPSAPS
jgi:hypothetical protein